MPKPSWIPDKHHDHGSHAKGQRRKKGPHKPAELRGLSPADAVAAKLAAHPPSTSTEPAKGQPRPEKPAVPKCRIQRTEGGWGQYNYVVCPNRKCSKKIKDIARGLACCPSCDTKFEAV